MPSTPERSQLDRARQLATRLDADHVPDAIGGDLVCRACAFGTTVATPRAPVTHLLAATQMDDAERWLGGRSVVGFGVQHVKDAVAALHATGAPTVTPGQIAEWLLTALPGGLTEGSADGRRARIVSAVEEILVAEGLAGSLNVVLDAQGAMAVAPGAASASCG